MLKHNFDYEHLFYFYATGMKAGFSFRVMRSNEIISTIIKLKVVCMRVLQVGIISRVEIYQYFVLLIKLGQHIYLCSLHQLNYMLVFEK